ncbi:carbonic anhydrase 14 [Chanos chanos]|uniref:carbonic anhydrase n=1 Tax=Chanos chanos TaxID=29144 RepID=A0A6J2WBZ3_CHACN|nr:carbonic anhydrase 14 [Chanos chanos]
MDSMWSFSLRLLLFWLWTSCLDAGYVGQSQWSEFFPDCGGSYQSPIDVDKAQAQYDPSLIPVQTLGYDQHGNAPFILSNNGHTVNMALPGWMGVAGLPWQFSAAQLHLHWGNGAGEGRGSEHTIDGRSAAAELHVVHYNSELYTNLSEAMTQKNGLAVLGVLIEIGEETNQAYANIINYLHRIKHAGQSVAIPAFDVRTLLPADLGLYYLYNGSLTTPPCYQSVLWTLFTQTVKISLAQLLKLETVMYSTKADVSEPTLLQDNYRTTQPLHNRTVLSSFPHVSVKVYTAGEVSAIVMGSLCGCVGLAVIIRFIVKTIRSTSSWDVLHNVRPTPQSRTNDLAKESKQDMDLRTTSDPGKKEESPPQAEP